MFCLLRAYLHRMKSKFNVSQAKTMVWGPSRSQVSNWRLGREMSIEGERGRPSYLRRCKVRCSFSQKKNGAVQTRYVMWQPVRSYLQWRNDWELLLFRWIQSMHAKCATQISFDNYPNLLEIFGTTESLYRMLTHLIDYAWSCFEIERCCQSEEYSWQRRWK